MGNQNLQNLGLHIRPHPLPNTNNQPTNLYNFNHIQQQQLVTPCYLGIYGEKLQVILPEKKRKRNCDRLLYRVEDEGLSGLVFVGEGGNCGDRVWKMLVDKENQVVRVGDSIKMGTIEMTLMILADSNVGEPSIIDTIPTFSTSSPKQSKKQQHQNLTESIITKCRICFQSTHSPINPLLSICNCQGSIKYTHYKCLQIWHKTKIKHIQQINYYIHEVGTIACDLCKMILPYFFVYDGKVMCLEEGNENDGVQVYAIFRVDRPQKQKTTYYKIKLFDGVSLSIGRGPQTDISIPNNPTIDKNHSSLFYIHKKLFIRDLASKTGTMHHSPHPVYAFNPQKGIYLLIGNNIVWISLLLSKSWLRMEIPRTCCAARMNMCLRVFGNEEDKRTMESSRKMFDFQFDLLD